MVAPILRSSSKAEPVGNVASGTNTNVAAPSGVAVGDYVFVVVWAAQALPSNTITVTTGWDPVNTDVTGNGTSSTTRLLRIYGKKMTSSSDVSTFTSNGFNAAVNAASRISMTAYAFSNVTAVASITAPVWYASSTSSVTPNTPSSGEKILVVGTNTSSPSTFPAHSSVGGGSLIIQATSKSVASGSAADSQTSSFIGGTGISFAAAVANATAQAFGVTTSSGANTPPTAAFTTSTSGLTVSTTSGATDSDGTIASTDYDWGDSTTHGSTANASHTYGAAGTYTITQTVTDNSGATATTTRSVTVWPTNQLYKLGTALKYNNVTVRLSGANAYWVGLDDNQGGSPGTYPTQTQITNAMNGIRDMGANLVRAHTVGMSAGTSMSFETAPGTFVDANLDAADYAVYQAKQNGIFLMVPLTDMWNYYHGGIWNFVHWAYQQNSSGLTDVNGSVKGDSNNNQFFGNTTATLRIRALFKAYISAWLNHVNPYTNLAYKDDPTIAIIETGNEIYSATAEWTQDIAAYIKSLAPNKLVADGSAATGLTVANQPGLNASSVDILGSHYYVQNADYSQKIGFTTTPSQYGSSTSALQQLAADVTSAVNANKAFILGEYPWTRADVTSLYAAVEANANISGDMPWSLVAGALTHGDSAPGGDDYSLHRPYYTDFEKQAAPRNAQHQVAMTGLAARSGATTTKNLLPTNVATASDTAWLTGGSATFSTDTGTSMEGGSSLKVVPASASYPYWAQTAASVAAGTPITPGQQYSAYAYVKTTSATFQFHSRILWANASGSTLSTTDGSVTSVTVAGGWTVVKVTGVAPAGAVRMGVQVQADNQMTTTDPFYVDEYGANFGEIAGPWVSPGAGNVAPVAGFNTSITDRTVTVTSTATDSDGTIASTSYNWGDGVTNSSTSHTYSTWGTYTITQTVTDNNGATGTTTRSVTLVTLTGIQRVGTTNYPGFYFYWDGTTKHGIDPNYFKNIPPVYTTTTADVVAGAKRPWFALHRGGSYNYPEETLYGYQGVIDAGAKILEVSLQRSSNGTWWCFHDSTVQRTVVGQTGAVNSFTDAQLATFMNGSSTAAGNTSQPARPVAKFADVLAAFPNHVMFVEDKTQVNTPALLDILDANGGPTRFIVKLDGVLSGTSQAVTAPKARGYQTWAYLFDASMANINTHVAKGFTMIGMDFNSSDATLTTGIAACIAGGVRPTGHIVANQTQRDRLLGLGMTGMMISNKLILPNYIPLS